MPFYHTKKELKNVVRHTIVPQHRKFPIYYFAILQCFVSSILGTKTTFPCIIMISLEIRPPSKSIKPAQLKMLLIICEIAMENNSVTN
jgi:hypothetical protein